LAKELKQIKKTSPLVRISQRTWERSNAEKVHVFTEHLAEVFQLHPSENEPKEEEALRQLLVAPTNSNQKSTIS
jgi:hypothetical protein